MKRLRAIRNGRVLLTDLRLANRFGSRLKGLTDVAELALNEGLLICPCWAIHTIGMRYPIDVAFLNREGLVVKTVASLGPRQCAAALSATQVLELRAGSLAALRIRVKDRISLEADSDDGLW